MPDLPLVGSVHHVGYLARDLDAGVALLRSLTDMEVVLNIARPEFELTGVYLGAPDPAIEVFTFTDAQLLERRLGGASGVVLDHVAYRVDDIDAVAESLRKRGVRFSGPDQRAEVDTPFELPGALHLWTLPESSGGVCLQLVEPFG